MTTKINIAIDGFSACGKSTLGKLLAKQLKYIYIDTGAMYRAVALYLLRLGVIDNIIANKGDGIEKFLESITLDFVFNNDNGQSEILLNNENVEAHIRNSTISHYVSKISSFKPVRQKLVQLQKTIAKQKGVVMDGRDIGTVVMPDAEIKIFLTADVDIRAQRRLVELQQKHENITLENVKQDLMQRDYEDLNRTESPLTKAKDAILLDNSHINIEEGVNFIMEKVKQIVA